MAREIADVEPDQIIGSKMLAVLNSYNGKLFDILFNNAAK